MTPDRRLDQLVELATTTKAELDQVKRTGELTANGLANLTISTQKQFNELRTGQEELRTGQDGLKIGQAELRTSQEELKVGQVELNVKVDSLRDELNQRFDQLVTLIQERLK